MAQKIYVVKRAEGEYDSYYEYLEKAFYEHSEAEKYVVDKTTMCKRLESYRDEWGEIENALEKEKFDFDSIEETVKISGIPKFDSSLYD